MEYQFTHTVHGVVAKCSMDHEAFARWLNCEISSNSKELDNLFIEIEKCKRSPQYEVAFEGKEYSLYLSADEVMAKANNLEMTFEEFEQMEDGFGFYNEESISFCGLEDFEMFLIAYQRFLNTYH